MNKITILIDHPRRDLLFATRIKNLIGENARLDLQDGFFTPDGPNFFSRLKGESLIVTPSYNVKRSKYITLRKNLTNSKLILFHSEQFITGNDYEEKLNLTNFTEFNKNVDLHLVWGQYYADILVKHGIPIAKIRIVGNPKLQLIKEYSRRIANEGQKCILFISNFNYAEFTEEEWIAFKREYSLPKNDLSRHFFSLAREQFIESIIRTSQQFPSEKIVVRLHPAERLDGYVKLKGLQNVEISSVKNVMFDLKRSKIVFQYTSSVIFEAIACGLPCFAILFYPKPKQYMQPPSENFTWYQPSQIPELIMHPDKSSVSFSNSDWKYYFSELMQPCEEVAKILIASNSRTYRFVWLKLISSTGLEMLVKSFYCYLFTKTFLKRIGFARVRIENSYSKWIENEHNVTEEDIEDLKLL